MTLSATRTVQSSDVETGNYHHKEQNETVEKLDMSSRWSRLHLSASRLVEILFTASAPPRPPSKLKMAVLTFLMIWVQVHFLVSAYGSLPSLSSSPLAVEAVTIFTVVFSTEFIWMPVAMYVLSCWLFPTPPPQKEEERQRHTQHSNQHLQASQKTYMNEKRATAVLNVSEESSVSVTATSREEEIAE
jgi:hypothetical protein